MPTQKRVLLVGLDPRVLDYSSGPLAGFNADGVMQVLEAGRDAFKPNGVHADMCLIDLGDTAESVLSVHLNAAQYDCIVIGAGLREPKERLELFERVLNLIHRRAPHATIAFNTSPADSLAAALRWLPA